MDYKELIEQLKSAAPLHGTWLRERMLDAATAIEILLAERDAAVEELHGRCSQCKHFRSGPLEFPCTDCRFESGTSDHWKWRGPQKEGGT